MKTTDKRLLTIIAWLVVIAVLSSIPKRYGFIPAWFYRSIVPWTPVDFSWEQLVSALFHIGMFLVLAFLAARALSGGRRSGFPTLLGAFIITMLVAFSAETIQELIPQRGFGVDDLVSDSIGALLGLLIYRKKTSSRT